MVRKVGKRGDTLIEVMLAVGIFSMVAVAIVSVMSGGTSSSQSALETTLAREEIDNQAEALRFIQRAYLADTKTGQSSPYGGLWEYITGLAVNAGSGAATIDISDYTKYQPTDCASLYNGGEASNKGFIIDPNGFADYEDSYDKNSPDYTKIVYKNGAGLINGLQEASTYPHIIYIKNNSNKAEDTELISNEDNATAGVNNSKFYRAEGIYIIAIKDPKGTSLANTNTASATDSSAYYDFYIRTCWYGAGDQAPSTISTVVRLYNPDLITDTNNNPAPSP